MFDLTKTTKVLERLQNNINNRYLIFYGGSSSSKTISILQFLTIYALFNKNKRITISAESLPVIRKTLLVDWRDIVMKDFYDDALMNKSEMIYKFPSGSYFQFVPADEPARWHGLRQDIVYFDELYNIKEEIYNQADIRTKEQVIASFNPTNIFWVADRFNDENTYVDHSTYKDNHFISDDIIKALERKIKTDINFYNVYVLGKWGNLEGLIFDENKHWFLTDEWPTEYKKRIYGLDFGFSIDPSVVVEIIYTNGDIYVRELLYKHGLTNPDIHKYLDHKTIADSAEPKSIEELRRMGADIQPAAKGPDSIRNGIKLMKEFNIYVHKESINIIKEFRNYRYAENKQGENLNKPIDDYNHTIDAIRYGLQYIMVEKPVFFI